MHIDNKGKDILILGEGSTQGLDDTTLTAFDTTFVLSLHYNGRNSFLFVNTTKLYQFKTKVSEIKDYALCLGNISKDFTINNMAKTRVKGVVTFFSVDFNAIDTIDILDIHKYLMKKKT